MSDERRAELLRQVADEQIQFVNLQFTDILGMVKTVTIPVEELAGALQHGVWFDGSSIEGFARVVESDMYLVPDLATYAQVPWDRQAGVPTARLICDVYTPDGKPFAGDPRAVLRRVLAQAASMGYAYKVGPELEFFLFKLNAEGRPVPTPHDDAGYFDVSSDQATHIRRQMVRALQGFGIGVEASHHEVAVGQHEIDLSPTDALSAADHSVTSRVVLKAVAQLNGLYATFMPKPVMGINGNGMHVHQNLVRLDNGVNAFHDGRDSYGLSVLARHFIAGLLAHARGMIAVLAPLVNSYKRLVPGFEAPVYLSWGRTNRSALVRVPRVSTGLEESTRVELRCPDPACNPYLAFAVMLAAGLDGIQRQLHLPEAAEEDLFHVDPRARGLEALPRSLGEALEHLRRDEVIQAALGPHVYERFIGAKQQEWETYRSHVSQWEVERYLPIF
ncbi:MAG: glutamine synthetase family protein [Chloroflexaceae bacterium]|jgi:glutamine synthetase|nr:glutamine synthetase family protein [Chloroflexaceae bacterium]